MNLNILRDYAQLADPSKLPSSILLRHNETSITIFDAFPKSIFHLLVLPRVGDARTTRLLADLKTLLNAKEVEEGDGRKLKGKEKAKEVLDELAKEANELKVVIEEEMMSRFGFRWGIWAGFHACPSMSHLHLHVLSDDLCSERMKNKKHYNSFHPKLGFFLHLEEVLSWFEEGSSDSYYNSMVKLDPKQYEPILKEGLVCWRCGTGMSNIPKLKTHLQEEWDKFAKKEKAKSEKKRKAEERAEGGQAEKKTKAETTPEDTSGPHDESE